MRNVLTYGDISSSDYDIFIGQETIYNVPERAVEVVSVPGRNGSLTIDQGHYENVSIEYYCFVDGHTEEEMHAKYNAYKNAIASVVGYQKIVDSYYPNEYRLGLFIEGIEADSVALGTGLEFRLIFNCKPQRYLASGDNEITVTNGMALNNPTLYDAEPLLMVEGYGNIGFNGYDIDIENALMGEIVIGNGLLHIDSETITFAQDITIDSTNVDNGDEIYFDLVISKSFAEVHPQYYRYTNAHTVTQNGSITNNNVTIGSTISALNPSAVIVDAWDAGASFNVGYNKIPLIYGQSGTFSIDLTIGIYNTDMPGDSQVMPSVYVTFDVEVNGTYDGANTISIQFSGSDGTNFADPSSRVAMTQVVYETYSVIGDSTISMLGNPTFIDCEIGEAYKYENDSLISLNKYIDLGSDLPKLAKGNNTFEIDGTITSLKVVPKWWQL